MATGDMAGRDLATITLPLGPVTYRTAGPADSEVATVVFVHPFLMDGSLWDGVADRLAADGVRSIALTWPLGAHREPQASDADLSPRGVARLIVAFLDALDLRDVTLVGNDTGGALVQFVLDTDPSRVGRVVLANCDGFDTFPPFPFNAVFRLLSGVPRRPVRRGAGSQDPATTRRPDVLATEIARLADQRLASGPSTG
jgi:pimeloyl-ACP methyl ester carboxylesterase